MLGICAGCNEANKTDAKSAPPFAEKKSDIEQLMTSIENDLSNSEVIKFSLEESIHIQVTFYSDQETVDIQIIDSSNLSKILVDRFSNLESEMGCRNPRLIDFNSDDKLDLLIENGTGARGANQHYYLFTKGLDNHFNLIKGSYGIANLTFNKDRNMIEAAEFSGGITFLDCAIENDSLVIKGGVQTWEYNGWTFHEKFIYDETGKFKNLDLDSIKDNLESLYSRER